MTISPIVDDQVADDDRFGMDLADRMTKALRHSGIGVQEMADYLEVSRNAVSSWINGRNEPRRRDLRAFALRTGYPMSWLEKGKRAPLDLSPDAEGLDSVTRH
ncbi:helix-turn-helix domain-containing protein [Microbacterium helvum]|nr:helix-turn-helix transcriptional regulator [Microbacterium helvum]